MDAAPDAKRVELTKAHLTKLAPDHIPILYNSASESRRREMESAAQEIGRVPQKSSKGLTWQPLLDPGFVDAAILERAERCNPTAAAKVRELDEVKAMQETITNVALSEV